MEIRPGEGGEDAKLLVSDQANIYTRYCLRNNISISVEDVRSGL
jgi:protein subunit release factor A